MVGRRALLSCLLAVTLAGCQSYGARLQASPAGYRADDVSVPDSPYSRTHWKAILLSGDNSIRAFDNAVRDLAAKFRSAGVEVVAILSPTSKDRPATHAGLAEAASELRPAEGEGCLLYATSHGAFHGLLLQRDAQNNILTPEELNAIAEYPVAVLEHAKEVELAREFVDFLLSPAGQVTLARFGFRRGTGG